MFRFLIAFVLPALLLPALALASESSLRTISTSGESSIYVTPDEVVLNVGVETFNANLDQAKAVNDQASARLVRALREQGVEQRHIQTANLEVEIVYRRVNEPSLGIEGYTARRGYSVTVKDPQAFEKLVDVVLKNGANRLMSFDFRTTELRKHRDEARRMAIKAAKEKAAALAGELGCGLGAPRTIQEGSLGYYGYAGFRWGWGNAFMTQNSMQVVGGGEPSGETLPLGQIAIRAQVNVTFDLVPQ